MPSQSLKPLRDHYWNDSEDDNNSENLDSEAHLLHKDKDGCHGSTLDRLWDFRWSTSRKSTNVALLAQFAIIVLLLALLLSKSYTDRVHFHRQCERGSSVPSPLLDTMASIPFVTRRFNTTVGNHSKYMGPPTSAVDTAWSSIIHTKPFVVSDELVRGQGKDPENMRRISSEQESTHGAGVLATSELGHQLHCLNMIRMYTYFEEYSTQDQPPLAFTQNTPDILRWHIDHCIDLIRESLMCSADTGFITLSVEPGRPIPKPDFGTMHVCRDFGVLMDTLVSKEVEEFV